MYRVIENQRLTNGAFRLRTERPRTDILAGQCFNVGLPDSGVNREYSMYSSAEAPYLDFLIKVVDDGCVSPQLHKARIGDFVEIDGPYGEFVLKDPGDDSARHLFIATGTGIAPFHSFVLTYPKIDYKLIHGIRYAEEMYGIDSFEASNYTPCISRDHHSGQNCRVTDYLLANRVEDEVKVFLCGNRSMIADCLEILRDQGVSGDRITTEVFF